MKFNEEKLSKLRRADEHFDECYGKSGTPSRIDFENKAIAWYYGEILRNKRKELKITQRQLAEKIGKKREYIALLEKGETDMQLSTFFNIVTALGLRFDLSASASAGTEW
ncbi:MAG: helix-turn-helix domain-containing protein [Tannerella sp.]|jgi:DNA-binding XRE family transcriptional regulator|nr:helix-turn-helix domain-containing protein [Tannerella sp.]